MEKVIKFNPTKSEIIEKTNLSKQIKKLDINDKEGYKKVHSIQMELRDIKVKIKKTGKALRDQAVKFQKDVIKKEKEILLLVEPEEKRLKMLKDDVNEAKKREERKKDLPFRYELLKKYEATSNDDHLLSLSNDEFLEFVNGKKLEYLEKKEEEERKKKAKEEEQKRIEEAKEEARREAKEEAKKEIIKARNEGYNDGIRQKEIKNIPKNTDKLKQFLKKNGVNEQNKKLFIVKDLGDRFVLYKEVGFLIKNND